MRWNDYILRRRINPTEWLKSRGISSRDSFCLAISELGLDVPSETELLVMFPAPEEAASDEPEQVEKHDTIATRVLAGPGDDAGVRPSGKSGPKLRGK